MAAHAMLLEACRPWRPTPKSFSTMVTAALCHRAVKFVLKHDRSGNAFRFAPLQGATYMSRVSAEQRASLPDSVVVLTEDGATLTRSDAFIHIFRRLGGDGEPCRRAGDDSAARSRSGLQFHRADSLSCIWHA